MKRTLILVLLSALGAPLFGASQVNGVDTNQADTINGVAGNASFIGMSLDAAGGGVTWLVGPADFEETGAPSGAYSTGTGINYDGTPAINGSQSLIVSGGYYGAEVTFAATGEVWWRFKHSLSTELSDYFAKLELYNGSTPLVSIENDGSTNFTLRCGSATTTGTGYAGATNLRFLVRYVKGTGSNAIAQVWISTTDTFPGSPTASLTNGTATLDANNYWVASTEAAANTLDDSGVATTNPGNF